MIYTKQELCCLVEELREDAELAQLASEAAEKSLYTVTRKRHILPDGGTPHDYVSIAPYWWPDPEKADGLPWIRRDGEKNPAFYEYDAATLHDFTACTDALILGGLACNRSDWLERAAMQLTNWFITPSTKMNPNMRYGEFVPGRCDGRCFGIIDVKFIGWLFELVELMPFSDLWTPEKLQLLREWALAMLDWLLADKLGVEEGNTLNNHAINYDCTVAMLALFVNRREVAARQLRERSIPRIAEQFAPDGSMPLELERTDSKGYSTFGLRCFMQAAAMGRRIGVEFPSEPLRRALEWLEANVNSSQWKWRQIVPFEGISPMVYQFAGMFFDEQSLIERAKAASRHPWQRMIEWRSAK